MMQAEVKKEPYILIVEDSAEDLEITTRSLRQAGFSYPMQHFHDGDHALDFLRQSDAATYPSLVLLDLNLPGVDGKFVLGAIKTSEDLKAIPVIILTTSDSTTDVKDCYDGGANSYIQKPMEFHDFVETARSLKEFWFENSVLPD